MNSRTKHGMYKTAVYKRWIYMKSRCSTNIRYVRAGITVCDRWATSFANFLADMGHPPVNTTLDRIDNNKGYSPENCRWATYTVQNNNKSTNKLVYGERMAQLVKKTGLSRSTIEYRVTQDIPLTLPRLGQRETCKKGHIMDEANTYTTKTKDKQGNLRNSRYCRKCRAEYQALKRKREKEIVG